METSTSPAIILCNTIVYIILSISLFNFFCVFYKESASNSMFDSSTKWKGASTVFIDSIQKPSQTLSFDESVLMSRRDPFALPENSGMDVLSQDPQKLPILRGVILAASRGVLLEEVPQGKIIFLSENQGAADIFLKRVSAEGAVITIGGREVRLQRPSKEF